MRIYFFTGTGNSYWSACQLANLSSASGGSPELLAIDNLSRKDIRPGNREILTGFIFPTHGFALPWYMLRFILRFPRGHGRVFIINNRAGMKMGKLFTPGISGIAAHLPMLILIIKGYKIAGTLPLDTPSNWISIHPGIRQPVVDSVFDRRQRDIEKLWDKLKQNRSYFPLKYLLLVPIDILLCPIGAAYLVFGRFVLARSYFSDLSCDGCGICADRCPTGAIVMKQRKPYWTHRCESCMRCSNVCPKKSVNSSIPVIILISWVLSVLSSYTGICREFWDWVGGLTERADLLVYYLVMWVVTLVISWMVYIVLFHLNRIKPFNYILSRSTPMFWWRRYIAPGFRGLYKSE